MKLDDTDVEEEKKKTEEEYKPLVDYLKDSLSQHLEKVVVTDRLTTSPCALVSSSYGYTANMERIIKAQALGAKGYTFHPLFIIIIIICESLELT